MSPPDAPSVRSSSVSKTIKGTTFPSSVVETHFSGETRWNSPAMRTEREAPSNRRTLLLLRSLGRLNLLPAFDGVCLSWSSSSSTPLRSLTSSKTTRSTEAKQLPALTAIGARALSHYLRLRSSRQRRRTRLRTNPGALTLFMTAFLRPAGRRPRSSVRPSVDGSSFLFSLPRLFLELFPNWHCTTAAALDRQIA